MTMGSRLWECRRSNGESGFTLVELAFVTLLLALLSGVIYGSVLTMVRTKNALEGSRVSERTAESVLTRLTRELENRQSEPLRPEKEGAEEAGERTSSEEVPLLLGRSRRSGGMDADSIRFTTIGNAASSELGNPGLIEVEYRLEALPPSGLNRSQTFALVREELPADVGDEKILEQRRFRSVLSDRVRALQFRYRFNRRWVNQWSPKRETLPDAVEITLSLASDTGGTDTYRTAVLLYRQEEG